nr:LAG1 longevity assurance 4 [Hymenolepis microstoma]
MLLHDAADFWLEAAKMLKYVGKFRSCMFCFGTFILVWTVTRLYYFPVWVISSIVFVAPGQIGFYPALNGFLAFLCGLQVLHLFWTIQIIQTALKSLTYGQMSSDARSDSEMSESESEHPNGLQKNVARVLTNQVQEKMFFRSPL